MGAKIYVISHKEYEMPSGEIYQPLQVGSARDFDGFTRDNTGDNIAEKNANYCELTGIYWAWKNQSDEVVGFDHYRRLLSQRKRFSTRRIPIGAKRVKKLLRKYDMILPRARYYFIETNYSHYKHAHVANDLDAARQIVLEKYPEYIEAFDGRMDMTWGHRCNMFITRRELFEDYCEWLFDILLELEKRIDISSYDEYDKRVYGLVAERLLDVWIDYNKLTYKEVPVLMMERTDWVKKCGGFLLRKIRGKKY